MNNLIGIAIICFITSVAGAYFHEGDIQRQCRETGKATAAWRGDFICKPAENEVTK
jgi:hypothetical protein